MIKTVKSRMMISRWSIKFKHRLMSDYFQSLGLGFFEYLQLAEELGESMLDGEQFENARKELKAMNVEISDEHYYRNQQWFFNSSSRYNAYDIDSCKIFVREYAAQSIAITSPFNINNWQCSLSEAAFMTGLERNVDVGHLKAYASHFAHVDGWQWTPDLIWFNNFDPYCK